MATYEEYLKSMLPQPGQRPYMSPSPYEAVQLGMHRFMQMRSQADADSMTGEFTRRVDELDPTSADYSRRVRELHREVGSEPIGGFWRNPYARSIFNTDMEPGAYAGRRVAEHTPEILQGSLEKMTEYLRGIDWSKPFAQVEAAQAVPFFAPPSSQPKAQEAFFKLAPGVSDNAIASFANLRAQTGYDRWMQSIAGKNTESEEFFDYAFMEASDHAPTDPAAAEAYWARVETRMQAMGATKQHEGMKYVREKILPWEDRFIETEMREHSTLAGALAAYGRGLNRLITEADVPAYAIEWIEKEREQLVRGIIDEYSAFAGGDVIARDEETGNDVTVETPKEAKAKDSRTGTGILNRIRQTQQENEQAKAAKKEDERMTILRSELENEERQAGLLARRIEAGDTTGEEGVVAGVAQGNANVLDILRGRRREHDLNVGALRREIGTLESRLAQQPAAEPSPADRLGPEWHAWAGPQRVAGAMPDRPLFQGVQSLAPGAEPRGVPPVRATDEYGSQPARLQTGTQVPLAEVGNLPTAEAKAEALGLIVPEEGFDALDEALIDRAGPAVRMWEQLVGDRMPEIMRTDVPMQFQMARASDYYTLMSLGADNIRSDAQRGADDAMAVLRRGFTESPNDEIRRTAARHGVEMPGGDMSQRITAAKGYLTNFEPADTPLDAVRKDGEKLDEQVTDMFADEQLNMRRLQVQGSVMNTMRRAIRDARGIGTPMQDPHTGEVRNPTYTKYFNNLAITFAYLEREGGGFGGAPQHIVQMLDSSKDLNVFARKLQDFYQWATGENLVIKMQAELDRMLLKWGDQRDSMVNVSMAVAPATFMPGVSDFTRRRAGSFMRDMYGTPHFLELEGEMDQFVRTRYNNRTLKEKTGVDPQDLLDRLPG